MKSRLLNKLQQYYPVLGSFAKYAFAILVLYFVISNFYSHWEEIKIFNWSINYYYIILSIFLQILTFILFSNAWCLLMQSFNHKIPILKGFKIAYISNLGRYIPGKIWPVFGIIYFLRKLNIGVEVALASYTVATILGIPPALLISSIIIYLYPNTLQSLNININIININIIILNIIVMIIIVSMPNAIIKIYNIIIKLLNRNIIKVDINRKTALSIYLWYGLCWVSYGLSFYVFMHGVSVGLNIPIMVGVGSFIMGYVIGYLAFFTPGGLGARELVLAGVLSAYLGPVSIGLALAARLWNLICEILAVVLAYFIKL